MSDFLKLIYLDSPHEQKEDGWKYRASPFAHSPVYHTRVKKGQKLTEGDGVKTVYKLELDMEGVEFEWVPGDTIGIFPINNKELVEEVLIRLGVEAEADKVCELQVLTDTKKKNATIPKHLPPRSTLRDIFLNHVDIHTPPKKIFLKSLASHISDPSERSTFDLSSQNYTHFITTTARTLLSLLSAFPSLRPPVSLLLEHLPPLQPRPYSISSSPLSKSLEITFFVSHDPDGRRGVCTGFLEDLILSRHQNEVSFYFRKPNNFRKPDLVSSPVILIATGTGIAPFRGFLQDWSLREEFGDVWMFYGCRYRDRDFLYKEEFNGFMCSGVVNRLNVTFSREGGEKRYVQGDIERKGEEFTEWVVTKGAKIYVCGDFKTVVKDVKAAIVECLGKYAMMGGEEAEGLLNGDKFIVDTWN